MQSSIEQVQGLKVVLTDRDDQSIRTALMHALFEDKTNQVIVVTTRKKHIDSIIACYMQKHFGYRPFTINNLIGIDGYELKDKKGKIIKITHMRALPKMRISPEPKIIFLQTGRDKGLNLIESIEKLEAQGNRILVVGKLDQGEDDILLKVSRRPGYELLTIE